MLNWKRNSGCCKKENHKKEEKNTKSLQRLEEKGRQVKWWGCREALEVLRNTNVQGLLSPEELAIWIDEAANKVAAASTTKGFTSEASSKSRKEGQFVKRKQKRCKQTCKNVQVHGSTTWKRWCRISCCRRDLKGGCRVCHAKERPKNHKEEVTGRREKSKHNVGKKDVLCVAWKKEQQTYSRHTTSNKWQQQYDMVIQYWQLR